VVADGGELIDVAASVALWVAVGGTVDVSVGTEVGIVVAVAVVVAKAVRDGTAIGNSVAVLLGAVVAGAGIVLVADGCTVAGMLVALVRVNVGGTVMVGRSVGRRVAVASPISVAVDAGTDVG